MAAARYEHYAKALACARRWELRVGDDGYPPSLLDLPRPPEVLYGVGAAEALLADSVSIVGARLATPYGLACARMAGRVAAECGVTVVSGGARGCDHEAGRAALDAGGATVVVPGCGADVLYPLSSDALFADAVERGGCVVSIEPWGTPPVKFTFVRRNDVIAALSRSLVVCEAGRPSGTFRTATTAAELGRRVYAVPGSIFSPTSQGANWLIESGAAVVSDEEALEALVSLDYGKLRMSPGARGRAVGGKLMAALVASPLGIDEVGSLMGTSVPETLALLSELEAAGLVCQLADGRFAPTKGALLGQNGSSDK